MKKLAVTILLFLFSVVPVAAQSNMCNQRCDVDGDCGSGYRCYVGVCRLNACPAVSSCVCTGSTSTPAPSATPKVTSKPTASPTATPKPSLKPSPSPVATISARLKKTPKTGFESWVLAGGSLLLFGMGSLLQKYRVSSST